MPDETLTFTPARYQVLQELASRKNLTVNEYLQEDIDNSVDNALSLRFKRRFLRASLAQQKAWADSQQEE